MLVQMLAYPVVGAWQCEINVRYEGDDGPEWVQPYKQLLDLPSSASARQAYRAAAIVLMRLAAT